jgi:ribose transport system ATP-binding protein
MLYVSHRLEEVFAIADRVTVARNGRDVFTRDRTDVTLAQVIEGMVGAQPDALFPARTTPRGSATVRELAVDRLAGGPLHEASFFARGGEIVGLAGLEGSGVAVLLGLLFGTRTARAGSARFPDGRGLPKTPTEAARRRICMVPGDRRRHGLMLDRSVIFNISEVAVGSLRNVFRYHHAAARDRAERQIAALRIKTRSPYAVVGRLSGGNQQKVVIGKWLEIAPEVVLLDDPTRGVDVGAKREIYRLIRFMADEGRIVLFSSTELPELVGLCDRIVVLYRGRVAGEVEGGGADSRALLHLVNTGAPPPDPGNQPGEQTVAH